LVTNLLLAGAGREGWAAFVFLSSAGVEATGYSVSTVLFWKGKGQLAALWLENMSSVL
jgi:hypothetical protein